MRGLRMLAVAGLVLLLTGELVSANAIPRIGPPTRSTPGFGLLRLRPWRVLAEPPVAHSTNVVPEGGEIILSLGANLPWYSFSPPAASPPPAVSPAVFQPVSVQPVAPTIILGGFEPPPTVATTMPASIAGSGIGVMMPAAPNPGPRFDALVNFGDGPFPGESHLTSGNAQAWYTSPVVQNLYGGRVPDAQEQASFTQAVLNEVRDTYLESGLHISLTSDPSANAAHTLSVVAGTSFTGNDRAIGIADIGGDGFNFVDKFTDAKNLDQLEVSMAKNIAHELMHSFGVDHKDTTGRYLDSATNAWSALYDRNTAFGPEAVSALAASNFQSRYDTGATLGLHQTSTTHQSGQCSCYQGSPSAQAVPEPTTVAAWSLTLGGLALARWRHRRRTA